MDKDIKQLEKHMGYVFKEVDLLKLALTHRSAGKTNNERLEFLGDAVLNFIIAQALYERFPEAKEGDMSRLRSNLVKGEALCKLANEIELGEFLQLGVGELKSGGHRRPSILAGAFEAVVGAIYLDNGFEACQACILRWYHSRLSKLSLKTTFVDAKTRLQEYLQGKRLPLPEYLVVDTRGESHEQVFVVHCLVQTIESPVEGEGTSRRKAEQAAAEHALEKLGV